MPLIYRYQEILKTLSEHPKGLTTQKLLKECRSKPGSELPDNSAVMSKIMYVLRNKKWITSCDTAGGGNTHKITDAGLDVLRDAEKAESEGEIQEKPDESKEQPEAEKIEKITAKDDDGVPVNIPIVDFLLAEAEDRFEKDFITISRADPLGKIVELINQQLETRKKQVIKNKDEKIEVLEKISALMSDDIYTLLQDIVNDLDVMS